MPLISQKKLLVFFLLSLLLIFLFGIRGEVWAFNPDGKPSLSSPEKEKTNVSLGLLFQFPGVIADYRGIECCKLRYDFVDVDENCKKGKVVAAPGYRACQWKVDATSIRWAVCCLLNTLYKISDWLVLLVMPFAILVFLAGAYTLTTSSGDPEKINKGRDYIIWAIVGAVVCFLIKAILAAIKTVV